MQDHAPKRHCRLQRDQDFDQYEQGQVIPKHLDLGHVLGDSPKERQVFDDLEVAAKTRYPRDVEAKLAVLYLFVHIPNTSFDVLELFGKIRLSLGAIAVTLSAFFGFQIGMRGHLWREWWGSRSWGAAWA